MLVSDARNLTECRLNIECPRETLSYLVAIIPRGVRKALGREIEESAQLGVLPDPEMALFQLGRILRRIVYETHDCRTFPRLSRMPR